MAIAFLLRPLMLLKNPALLKLKAFVLKRCPYAIVLGGSLAANTVFFRRERRYLKGRLASAGTHPSVLYFSLIRSGSQFVGGLIERLYAATGGESLTLQNYFFHGRSKDLARLRERGFLTRLLRPIGFYYGSLSPTTPRFEDDAYRIIVGVRDPRDVMVSFFYSLAFAHAPSDAKFVRDSREAREKGIEWFVRQPERISSVREDIEKVLDDYWDDERAFRWRYEDMMSEFPAFLDRLSRHICGDRHDPELVAAIVAEREAEERRHSGAGEDAENLSAHRRSGKSGTFRAKLKPETVEMLNEEFAGILECCGYPRDAED